MAEQIQVFYELLVRGEFANPERLGLVRGASVTYWPMIVENGQVIMRAGMEQCVPRDLAIDDQLPAELAGLNQMVLVSLNEATARIAELETELARARAGSDA